MRDAHSAWRERVRRRLDALDPLLPHPLPGAVIGVALVAALIPLLHVAGGSSGPLGPSIPLFFLVPVLLASAIGGRRAGVVVSCLAIFAWDWYFIPPFYTVTIYYPRDVLALVVFLAVALLVGQLADVARRRTEEALRRARSSEALYDLSLALITRGDLGRVLPTLAERLRATFDLAACAVVLRDEAARTWQTAAVAGELPPDARVEESRSLAAIAQWAIEHGQPSALGDGGKRARPQGAVLYQGHTHILPLRVGARSIGVLELIYKERAPRDREQERLLETFANGAALALEQERLAAEEQAAAVARASDRLKSALLSSVSHDLRTPLAGIKAAASSLLQHDVQWSAEDRDAFAADIDHEADRLTRLVSNLLDLSRIEAGAITADRDWEDVGELVERVVRRQAPLLGDHPIVREVAPGLPPIRLDAVQTEQVVTNLLENAAKYSPAGTPIAVAVRRIQSGGSPALAIAVTDQGVGIPRAEQGRVFDKFYRVAASARGTGGTGMGLAIVKGLVEANGGRVAVVSTPGEGSTFTVTLLIESGTKAEAKGLVGADAAVEQGSR